MEESDREPLREAIAHWREKNNFVRQKCTKIRWERSIGLQSYKLDQIAKEDSKLRLAPVIDAKKDVRHGTMGGG